MRQITITFKQEDAERVACTADFGSRDQASKLENKLADASQTSIAIALKRLPAALLGEGYGSTEQEAEQLAKVDARSSHIAFMNPARLFGKAPGLSNEP